MTQQEIIEGNKLIAEFMGYDGVDCPNCKHTRDCNWLQCGLTPHEKDEQLKYHSSWDWLMKVVQKIWGITNCSDSIFRFTVGYKTYIMLENNTGKHIEVCWNACLAFIKWYNQNKPV